MERFRAAYDETETRLWVRGRDEIADWFGGLDGWRTLEPGVRHLADRRPDAATTDEPQLRPFAWCGVGRRRC